MLISVSGPCPPTDGATAGRSGHRGLTQYIVGRKAAVGPAARPKTPLAAENSVGEPAAVKAPNAGTWERERGELPLPLWPRLVERLTGVFVFFVPALSPMPTRLRHHSHTIPFLMHSAFGNIARRGAFSLAWLTLAAGILRIAQLGQTQTSGSGLGGPAGLLGKLPAEPEVRETNSDEAAPFRFDLGRVVVARPSDPLALEAAMRPDYGGVGHSLVDQRSATVDAHK
jgi:hypothetical protein